MMTEEKSPWVLLHGALGSADQMRPIILELNAPDARVLEFFGHGRSTPDERDFSIPAFAKQLGEYLVQQDLPKVRIFGYSMGGYVALYLARLMPERITSITTLGTKFHWDPQTAQREVKMLNPGIIQEKVPRFAQALQNRHGQNHWEEVLAKTAKMMLALGEQPALSLEEFGELSIPVRVGWGSADVMVSREESERVAQTLPQGDFHILPEVKHPIEQVNLALLARYLRGELNSRVGHN